VKQPPRSSRPKLPLPGSLFDRETGEALALPPRLPVLPLRDRVLFPRTVLPLFVGRPGSLAALEEAEASGGLVLAVAQRDPRCPSPVREDLYSTGTVGRILQSVTLADGTRRVLMEGIRMARLGECREGLARFTLVPERSREDAGKSFTEASVPPEAFVNDEAASLIAKARASFARCMQLDQGIPREARQGIEGQSDPEAVAFRIASHLRIRAAVAQRILECHDPLARLRLIARVLDCEIEGLDAEAHAQAEAAAAGATAGAARRPLAARKGAFEPRTSSSAGSRPGFGGLTGPSSPEDEEIEELARAVQQARLPAAATERAERELARLRRTLPMSPEAAVSRNYVDWLLALPWRRGTRDRTDLARAQAILDEDHYGLREVKERILELIAVMKLSRRPRATILCLSGPPGVGKTSLGRSIARALGRRFVRMSLGGVRDEAEIRGHRRTYVGSLPGRIIQAMRRAGAVNPVILLDEVDKLARDGHGDPAAALLEVLDPEQNHAFNDHYLEVDYDLSRVLFLATANVLESIPPALVDRMEVLRLPGYLESEKREIARRFLVPRQMASCGLEPGDLVFEDQTLLRIIRDYTREAGVRNLEREIARLCRRTAKIKAGAPDPAFASSEVGDRAGNGPAEPADGEDGKGNSPVPLGIRLRPEALDRILGVPMHAEPAELERTQVGMATGLAWTPSGGEILTVEAQAFPGRGRLLLTGQLGEQLRESARTALSCIRSRARELGLDEDFHRATDVHIHLPQGAIPKDGPSAGVTILLALVSALTRIGIRPGLALTGETTLRGKVLPVGGLAEKLLAAKRAGVRLVVLPQRNARQVEELPEEVREGIDIRLVSTIDEILELGLMDHPALCGALRDPMRRVGALSPARAAA